MSCCEPHPGNQKHVLVGQHLDSETCWEPATCFGCKPCPTHNPATTTIPVINTSPRPVQRPAANSEARKRAAEDFPETFCGCHAVTLRAGETSRAVAHRTHTRVICTPPDDHEPPK